MGPAGMVYLPEHRAMAFTVLLLEFIRRVVREVARWRAPVIGNPSGCAPEGHTPKASHNLF
jgi:hypothetical protein